MAELSNNAKKVVNRRSFIGGSDARIIMGDDEAALLRLWREKRGEIEPEDLTGNLIVQLGTVTEHLNRHWYERHTGQVVAEVQRQVFHPVKRWMAATLDGLVDLGRDGGREAYGPAAAQHVGHGIKDCGAVNHHRRRQMGGNDHSGRSALPAPPAHCRKEVLALRGKRRGTRLFGVE